MDIAAHRFKPHSNKFYKKLQYTQRGIRRTYELFERVFNDSRTAYLMTSDHGMNNEGKYQQTYQLVSTSLKVLPFATTI